MEKGKKEEIQRENYEDIRINNEKSILKAKQRIWKELQ